MREMFIEKGFNDFISKPIDVSKLDEILDLWIPEGKKEKNSAPKSPITGQNKKTDSAETSELFSIPGVNTAKGVAMTGGTLAAYKRVLNVFCKDIEERLPLMKKTPSEETLPFLVTQFHALKAASGSLGAADISAAAASLELAGKGKDIPFISENMPVFTQQLTELVSNIKKVLGNSESEERSAPSSFIEHAALFEELTDALKNQNSAEIDRIISVLGEKQLDPKTKIALEEISDEVLMTEFYNALEIINCLKNDKTK